MKPVQRIPDLGNPDIFSLRPDHSEIREMLMLDLTAKITKSAGIVSIFETIYSLCEGQRGFVLADMCHSAEQPGMRNSFMADCFSYQMNGLFLAKDLLK